MPVTAGCADPAPSLTPSLPIAIAPSGQPVAHTPQPRHSSASSRNCRPLPLPAIVEAPKGQRRTQVRQSVQRRDRRRPRSGAGPDVRRAELLAARIGWQQSEQQQQIQVAVPACGSLAVNIRPARSASCSRSSARSREISSLVPVVIVEPDADVDRLVAALVDAPAHAGTHVHAARVPHDGLGLGRST